MSSQSRLPIATLILIAGNIAASFLLIIQPDLILDFGFNPSRFSVQSLFTSLFLHSNLLHLLGNMLFLAAVGAAVELSTGTLRFVVVYFVSGLAGIGLHALLATRGIEPHPLVGASGCIAGCAAYYGVRYPRLKVAILPHRGVPVLAIILLWFVLQVAGGLKNFGESAASTAYWAHVGGLLAGIILSFVFRAPDMGHLKIGHRVLEEMNQRGPAAAAAAALQHLKFHPNDPKALQQLVQAHALMNDHEGEGAALVKMIQLLPQSDYPSLLDRLLEIGQIDLLTPLQRMKLAEKVADPDLKIKLYESVVAEDESETQRPDAMLALAGQLREVDPARAKRLLANLAYEYPLHGAVEVAQKRGWIP